MRKEESSCEKIKRKKQEGELKTEIKRRQLIGKTNDRMIRRRTMYGDR